jgi:DHA1 family tetracycline resistance protein-like MFS transporter
VDGVHVGAVEVARGRDIPAMTSPAPGKRSLVFVALTVLLDSVGFGLIVPVLPALLVELTGKSVNVAAMEGGYLAFVYATMQFIFAPVLGNLSDRYGRRPVLLFAVGALGVDYIVMGLAPNLAWLFVGRAIAGLAGASFTPAYAYIADISPPEKRAQNYGMVSAMFGAGFIIGPALGGLLGGFGPRAPFLVAAGLSLCNFVYGVFALPESLPVERRRAFDWKRANPVGTLLQMLKRPVVPGVLLGLFLWMVAHQVMPAVWSFYTKFRFSWPERTIGLSLAAAGICMMIAQTVVLRRLVSRLGERGALLTAVATGAIGYIGFGLATAGWMMFAFLVTWMIAAIVMPTANALMSHLIDPTAQGELQGAVASLFSVASIVGPLLMSQLFARFTAPGVARAVPGASFFAAAALAVMAFGVFWMATRERGAVRSPEPAPTAA